MTLWQLPISQKAIILEHSSLLEPKYLQRVKDLGFSLNEEVVCLRQLPFSSPRVYQVQSSIYALEKDIADLIFVKVIHE